MTRTPPKQNPIPAWHPNSPRLLAAIVQASEDAIITRDLDGIVTSWNPAATRMLGYLPNEVIGQPILKLVPEDLYAEEMEVMRRLRDGERIGHFRTRRLAKSGRELTVLLMASPLRDGENRVEARRRVCET